MENTDKCQLPGNFRKFTVDGVSDNVKISVMTSSPEDGKTPEGIIQIVHGMCEHKERYIPFMDFLSKEGFFCIIHDHRGHGGSVSSPEDLGYFHKGGYKSMVEEIRTVNEIARKTHPGLPLLLLGHSMGSMAVRSFVKKYDNLTNALIVCGSPSRNPAAGAGKMLANVIAAIKGERHRPKSIQKMSFGMFNRNFKDEGSPNAWICSDKAVVQAYDKNPLCTFQFTANGFSNLFSLMQETYGKKGWKMSNSSMPVLFISGEDDPCAAGKDNFLAAVGTMKEVGYTDVEWKFYKGMRHEILNEKEKDTVWNDVLEFARRII